jgi:small subunit ribosomal protein S5
LHIFTAEDDEDFDNFYDADEEEAEMRRKKREVRRQEAFAKATADEDSGTWEDVKVRFEGEDEETMKNLERWIRRGAGDAVGDDSVDGGGAQGEHKMVYNELGEQVVATHKLENVLELKDKDGRQWYGAILNNDTVQKVMPGDRQMSARCLVVIGNARGTAGFGMGKGKEASDALNAAFRAATRNLVHIDLYDNFGLYHDVYGKHNNCHAIIKAYGKNKEPTTSEFAQTVLDCFGITGCSAKLMGRRDPYAMVNAMFNAVANHCNIDEQAKGRGKRYITLKWAKDRDL